MRFSLEVVSSWPPVDVLDVGVTSLLSDTFWVSVWNDYISTTSLKETTFDELKTFVEQSKQL